MLETTRDACKVALRKWMLTGNYLDNRPVAAHLLRERSAWSNIGPHDICPCGTGEMYGNCHGLQLFSLPAPKAAATPQPH